MKFPTAAGDDPTLPQRLSLMLLYLHARNQFSRTQTEKPFIERGNTLLPYLPVMLYEEKWPAATLPPVEPAWVTESELMISIPAVGNDPPLPLPHTHTHTHTEEVLSASYVDAVYLVQ
eukprot:SAG31_NODE_6749_length_1900_cov_3.448640_3_plen_118_part_00